MEAVDPHPDQGLPGQCLGDWLVDQGYEQPKAGRLFLTACGVRPGQLAPQPPSQGIVESMILSGLDPYKKAGAVTGPGALRAQVSDRSQNPPPAPRGTLADPPLRFG